MADDTINSNDNLEKGFIEDEEGNKIKIMEFDIPESKKIKIKTFSGHIIIHGTEEEKIKVKSTFRVKELFSDKEIELDVDVKTEEDGTIKLLSKINKEDGSFKKFDWDDFFGSLMKFIGKFTNNINASIDFEVWLPNSMHIIAHTHNGRFELDNFDGKSDLKTMNGRIEMKNVSGDINVSTHNGRIVANKVIGNLNSETYNGRIVFIDSDIKKLYAKTMNGRIMMQIKPNEEGPYNLKTMNGRIVLAIPKDSSININGKTMCGKLVNRITEEVYKSRGPNTVSDMKMGEGKTKINAHTMRGNIYIMEYDEFDEENIDMILDDNKEELFTQKGYQKNHYHFQTRFHNNSEEVKMILEMVKEGKISSEEGERLIKAVK